MNTLDNDFIFHWNNYNNSNIISITKTVIEKSLETNNIIMNYKIGNKLDVKKIIHLLADDITMCQSLHSICSFLQHTTNNSTNNTDTQTSITSITSTISNNPNSQRSIIKAEILLSNHENYLNSEVRIYNKLLEIRQYKNKLSGEDLQFIDKLIMCYKKSGIELSQNDKNLLQKIDKEIDTTTSLIIKHALTSDNLVINISYDHLSGMPLHIINTFENIDCDNVKIKLNRENYNLCMSYINNVKIRKGISEKYSTHKYEKIINHMAKLVVLKDKHDKLLSYNNHSEYMLSNQMCKDTEQVQLFLNKLLKKVNVVNKTKQNIWDSQYQITQWKLLNGFSNDIVKEYFEINDIIVKIIKLYELIFSIKFVKLNNVAIWCDNLMVFSIYHNNNLKGYLYLDLFNREGKYKQIRCYCLQSACMYPVASGKYIKPIVALCASFDKFMNGKSLLNYDEVVSIFHEFGHVLHHIFGKTKYVIFSGVNVEDDFIETPAQLMELLCYEPFIIKYLSDHYCKKEKLSENLINKIIMLNDLENNLSYKKDILISYFDQVIYSSTNFITLCENALVKNKTEQIQPAFEMLYNKLYGELLADKTNILLPNEITQIICDSGGQYYNLLWSKMLAIDLYNENIKGKYIDGSIGTKIIDCIFKFGGTKTAFEMCALYIGKPLNEPTYVESDNITKNSEEKIYETYDNSIYKQTNNVKKYTNKENDNNDNDCVESVSNNFCEIIDE